MTRLLAFLPIVWLLCSCSKPPAVATPLSPAEAQALTESFARLEKVLATKATVLHTNLTPPATVAEIAVLRAALNGTTNLVLEAWFGWCNGTTNQSADLLPLGRPLSIAEALEDRKLIQSIPLVDKLRRQSLKIMDDGAGDGFFVDVTSSRPRVFYHMLEDGTPQYYGTMPEFVNFIATGFETGVLFVNTKGEFAYDHAQYEALEQKHFQAIGKR